MTTIHFHQDLVDVSYDIVKRWRVSLCVVGSVAKMNAGASKIMIIRVTKIAEEYTILLSNYLHLQSPVNTVQAR